MSQSKSSESEAAAVPPTAPVQESYWGRMLITLIACAALIIAAVLYSR